MQQLKFTFASSQEPSPLLIQTCGALPGITLTGRKITILTRDTQGSVWNMLCNKPDGFQEYVHNKSCEYLQMHILSTILHAIIGNHRLRMGDISGDIFHGVDIILQHGREEYCIDLTLNPGSIKSKINNRSKYNKSDWVVCLVVSKGMDILTNIFSGYAGDFSSQSLNDFLKENLNRLQYITCQITERRTGNYPTLLANISHHKDYTQMTAI